MVLPLYQNTPRYLYCMGKCYLLSNWSENFFVEMITSITVESQKTASILRQKEKGIYLNKEKREKAEPCWGFGGWRGLMED